MTSEILFEAVGEIDDSFIDEAKELLEKKPKTGLWKKFAVAAACFAVIFIASFPLLSNILSPIFDTRHSPISSGEQKEINGIPIVSEVPKHPLEVSPDNTIAVNPAKNNTILYCFYSHEFFKDMSDSEKKAFEETFTNKTGYALEGFAESVSMVYPTNEENVCLENRNTYVFNCKLYSDKPEYANIRIAAKSNQSSKKEYEKLVTMEVSSQDFHPVPLSETVVMSEISGVPVKIFLLDKKYPVSSCLLKNPDNDAYTLIYEYSPVYIAIFENDKVNFQVEALTGDVSKLELLITAILTTPQNE